MKKTVISFLLTAAILLSVFAAVPFSAGAADGEYHVNSEADLLAAQNDINSHNSGTFDVYIDTSFESSSGFAVEQPVTVNVFGEGNTITFKQAENRIDLRNGATVNLGSPTYDKELILAGNPDGGFEDVYGLIYVTNYTLATEHTSASNNVEATAKCNMYNGVTIKDHKMGNSFGGGVTVEGGLFRMYGGTISNCGITGGSVCYGGGVAVFAGGEFIMDNGTITECKAESDYIDDNQPELCYTAMGGGVFVSNGSTFIMNGGTISKCSATNMGGGVAAVISKREQLENGIGSIKSKVVINSGTITENDANYGAGVFASGYYCSKEIAIAAPNPGIGTPDSPGFCMNGGTVSNNTAVKDGGGVFVCGVRQESNILLSDMTISKNTASSGAGIMIDQGLKKAVITDCTISDNTSTSYGGGIALTKNYYGNTLINDTTITGNTMKNNNNQRGAGVYYDIESKLELSGADIIQDNTYNDKLNNLNILSEKKPVYVTGDLTGSKIGVSDPTLWDDGKEDTDADAVSTKRLTSGFKTNNASLIPADAFTSDHDSWYVDYGEKYDSPNPTYKYSAKKYDNTLGLSEGYEIQKRDNGDLFIKIPATTFTGYTENVGYLYNELCYLYDSNNNYTYVKDYELYGYLSSYPGKIYYDKITKVYVAVFKMNTSGVYILTSSDPNRFEDFDYDNVLFMASGNVQQFLENEENTLALKIYYYYDETDISGLIDDTYTEKELEYNEPLTFGDSETKTIEKIDPFGYMTTRYVIIKNSQEEVGSYDYTGEVRLVRRTAPIKFHDNKDKVGEGNDKLFRVYNDKNDEVNGEIEDGKRSLNSKYQISPFYDIPSFAEDDYVFAGWYTTDDNDDNDDNNAFKFDSEIPASVTDVYAHWIPVGEVNKDADDDKELPEAMGGKYSGFELFGVQIRPESYRDTNYGDYMPGGLRFVTSISEDLLHKIDILSDKTTNGNKVEYGFVTASEDIINTVTDDDRFGIDKSAYKLQYKGENVNGVDTLLANASGDDRKTPNNFRYITNVDCTSKEGGYGGNGGVKEDHRNFTDYRLATYVVTYSDDESGENKGKNVAARAYMRYYDVNGLLRTFYNDYGGTSFYGGCSISYNTAEQMSASNTFTTR